MTAALFIDAGAWPLLLLVPLAWLVLAASDRRRAQRLRVAVGPRLDELATGRAPRRRRVRRAAFVLALLLALVAVLGPAIGVADGEADWRGVDLVVCLDVSRSMRARDEDPDRLGRAQREIRALAERAAGDRLALVVFAGEARLVSPLTSDAASFSGLADLAHPTDVARGGTDLGAAIDTALTALASRTGEQGAILLLTDGEDLAGRGRSAAQRARAAGVVVHAVGYGSARGSKISVDGRGFVRDATGADVISSLDVRGLEAIAAVTGGRFVEAGEGAPLLDLYEDRVLPMARAARATEATRKDNGYQAPLLAALFLFLLHLALGERRRA